MNFLPFDPSDSEDEIIEQQLLTPTTTSTADTPTPSTNPYHPIWNRCNEDTTALPTHPTLVLATDLASSAYLLQTLSHSTTPINPSLTLTSTIQQPRKPHASRSPNTTNSTATPQNSTQPKQIVYSFYTIPSTSTIIGVSNVDIPSTYGNHIAQFIFDPKQPYLTDIGQSYCFYSLPFTSLSSSLQEQLNLTASQSTSTISGYPIVYQLDNISLLPVTTTTPETTLTNNIPTFPSNMGHLSGFIAAIFAASIQFNTPLYSTISILNNNYLVELFQSFERSSKLYSLQPHLPSIYGTTADKLPRSLVSTTMKSLLARFNQLYATQQRIIPHAKQSGPPAAVFF